MDLPVTDEEGVVLLVELEIPWDVLLEHPFQIRIALVPPDQPQAGEDPPGVGVDHEGGLFRGVEDNGIGGLGADARHRKEPFPERFGRQGKEPHKPTVFPHQLEESPKPFGLLIEVASGADEFRDLRRAHPPQALGGEDPGGLQVGDGFGSVPPVGGLGEDRPHRHLEGAFPGPPSLGAVCGKEPPVYLKEHLLCPHGGAFYPGAPFLEPRPQGAYAFAGMEGTTPILLLGPGAEIGARAEAARVLRDEDLEAHPDLRILAPKSTGSIGIEAVREALAWARYGPLRADRKVVLIGPAERLTHEAASALLKSLEESPPYLVYILYATAPDRVLPTIRSRCRAIWFGDHRSYWTERLAEAGYNEEERAYLLDFLEFDPDALRPFVRDRRFPLEEARDAEEELGKLPPGELIARFIAYAGDPIRRRVAARCFLRMLPEIPVSELFGAAERLARGGREVVLRFLAEYFRFLYSEAPEGWCDLSAEGRRHLLRRLSLAKAEVEANANLRLLLEVVLLWPRWGS